jgi:cytochrome c biogenesis protein CcmG, thiol:disulfide interchange protein DsbE
VEPLPREPEELGDAPPAHAPARLQLRPLVVAQALAVGLVLALFGLLVREVVYGGEGGRLVAAIKHGERPPAPAFSLPVIWDRPEIWPARERPALADGTVALAEVRGTPVVLNFWASWCIPCKEEAPFLAASARAHRRDVAFLGIDIQDFERDARRFLEKLDVPYPSVRDGTPKTHSAYGLTGVPETYYVDAQGRIVEHAVGAVSRRELAAGVAKLLQDAP